MTNATDKYPADRNDYWKRRSDALIYRYTKDIARHHAPKAQTAIDIGCYVSPVICDLDWVPTRYANDMSEIEEWERVRDVTFLHGDARALDVPALTGGKPKFDILICHQTIEHIDDAKGFAEALCAMGNLVICSTSYKIAAGAIPGHIQDPIDLEKFEAWFPRRAKSIVIENRPDPRFANILGVF